DALLALLQDRRDRIERRMRRCLALASQCRQTPRVHEMKGAALSELLGILAGFTDAEVPVDTAKIPGPTWVGRVIFRQILALYLRKDYGPKRGLAAKGRLALLRAAVRFVRGRGAVPRMHGWLPETTFEKVEENSSRLTPAAEDVLERYYLVKVGSL